MEQVTLTTPIADFKVSRLDFDWSGAYIGIVILSVSDNTLLHFSYIGQLATDLMKALNKADLSVKSLHRRVLEYLINDGKLAGTISGAPD